MAAFLFYRTLILRKFLLYFKCINQYIYGDGTKLNQQIVMAPVLGDGEWHDLALKYADDQITLTIDGKVAKTILPARPLTDSTVRFTVGDRVAAGYQPFPGLIEYIKIIKF